MVNEIFINIVRFVVLVLIQGLLLNDINLWGGMAIPYLYVLFILLLPIDTPRWLELILGFCLGLSIDMFTNTIGIHASACVFLAFIRPILLKAIAPRDGYEFGQGPTVQDMGFSWFLRYALILILVHHTWFFFVEIYSIQGFFTTTLRIILSSIFTLVLVILTQFLFFSRRSARYS